MPDPPTPPLNVPSFEANSLLLDAAIPGGIGCRNLYLGLELESSRQQTLNFRSRRSAQFQPNSPRGVRLDFAMNCRVSNGPVTASPYGRADGDCGGFIGLDLDP